MIEYFKNIFNKPKVLWTFTDELALFGLFMGIAIICIFIYVSIYWIVVSAREHKYYTCATKNCTRIGSNGCRGCKKYTKKSKKGESIDEQE